MLEPADGNGNQYLQVRPAKFASFYSPRAVNCSVLSGYKDNSNPRPLIPDP